MNVDFLPQIFCLPFPSQHVRTAMLESFNPEPAARPAMVRSHRYTTSGRDMTPCIARRRDRELSHRLTLAMAGLAAGSGLNELWPSQYMLG
jgi:hypothetical protein